MMTLQSNKQSMKYSIQGERVPIYETDENGNIIYYTDSDGNKIPMETGEYTTGYSQPVSFDGNIAMSGGEAKQMEYGVDTSDYEAILIMSKGEIPITETSLIWYESEVKYNDEEKTIVDTTSADFIVSKLKPSIDSVKYLLSKITK